tara:strand:+ start:2005 stop:2145 length:141 start_codon:yes stop_codon:yes gene_type:complete
MILIIGTLIVLFIVVWLGYEMLIAPLMPDDYGIEEEDLELENKDKK